MQNSLQYLYCGRQDAQMVECVYAHYTDTLHTHTQIRRKKCAAPKTESYFTEL